MGDASNELPDKPEFFSEKGQSEGLFRTAQTVGFSFLHSPAVLRNSVSYAEKLFF